MSIFNNYVLILIIKSNFITPQFTTGKDFVYLTTLFLN